MIKITNSERKALERVGLFRHKRNGYNRCDPSFYVANKEHTSRSKHTYIVEEPEVMRFLGKYENLNLQRINDKQLESLQNAGYINEQNTQKWGQYVPGAICFEGPYGEYRIVKMTAMMIHLGLWKDNKRKRMAKQQNENANYGNSNPVGFYEAMLNSEETEDMSKFEEEVSIDSCVDKKNSLEEQLASLGNPEFYFKDIDTGEIVASGTKEDLQRFLGGEFVIK